MSTMQTPRQPRLSNRGAYPGRRRRKRGFSRFAACAARVLLLTLAVCGCLYIREHVFRPKPRDSGTARPDDAALRDEEAPARGTGAMEPVIPAAGGPIVVLDAGHGGVQAGCAFGGVLEKDITLSITLLAAEKLEALGVTVVLTRDADTDVTLEERCETANAAGATLFVSIHCNSYTEDPSIRGFEGYYHDSAEGRRLAEAILDAAGALSVETRNVKDEDYYVLRETTMPAALMEVGFMSNADECAGLQTAAYQDTIAQAIADGVMAVLGGG